MIIVYGIVLGNVGGYIIVDLIVLEETFLLFFANQQYVAGNIHTKVVFIFIITLVIIGQCQFNDVQCILT